MTADDIVRVATTVAVAQICCDLLAKKFVYQKPAYQRALDDLKRAQTKYDKLEKEAANKSSGKQQDKVKKRLDRAKDDLGEAKAEVAKRHGGPGMLTSFVFVVLFRILGAEHYGKVMGIIPFVPWRLLRKATMRGLDFGTIIADEAAIAALFKDSVGVHTVHQAASFTIIYLLCNMGVKFFVHKLVGEPAPPGADGGIMSVIESPKIAKGLRQMGLDPDELKQD